MIAYLIAYLATFPTGTLSPEPEDLSLDEWKALCHGKLREPPSTEGVPDSAEAQQNPFRNETTADGKRSWYFAYLSIIGMDATQVERWKAIDVDGNGVVDLNEGRTASPLLISLASVSLLPHDHLCLCV